MSNVFQPSQNGKQQADDLVELVEKPDKIIVSKFIRTVETAEPLIKKLINENHDHDVHLWLDTHEFDSVGHEKISEMKAHKEYLEANESYWKK